MLSVIFTIALPTITPSATFAIFSACSGVLIPKPTAAGTSVTSLISLKIDSKSVLISLIYPISPCNFSENRIQYTLL